MNLGTSRLKYTEDTSLNTYTIVSIVFLSTVQNYTCSSDTTTLCRYAGASAIRVRYSQTAPLRRELFMSKYVAIFDPLKMDAGVTGHQCLISTKCACSRCVKTDVAGIHLRERNSKWEKSLESLATRDTDNRI